MFLTIKAEDHIIMFSILLKLLLDNFLSDLQDYHS